MRAEESGVELTPRLEAAAMMTDGATVGGHVFADRMHETEFGIGVEPGAQARDVMREQLVVVIEEVEPLALRGVECCVRCVRTCERMRCAHDAQGKCAAMVCELAMFLARGDDDDFDVRIILR